MLSQLKELKLHNIRPTGDTSQQYAPNASLPGSVLASLHNTLTSLRLSQIDVPELHWISTLSRLCTLSILPAKYHRARLARDIGPQAGFTLPPSLREFNSGTCRHDDLYGVPQPAFVLDPSVFASCVQLTCIDLDVVVIEGHRGASGGGLLLEAVSQQQRLESLRLVSLEADSWPAPAPVYGCLPEGVWAHAITPDCTLPKLTRLCLSD